ncbi:MAG: GIY-YIG nuclease family protein [Parcubacteria group bacterium]|nr:GIY-YIG nuclease family protein [Parcubacteria group bacterium]
MHYVYILWSSKSKNFYYGYTEDLRKRQKLAKDFERYLKSGSGKAFAYKRLLNTEALKKDD